MDSGIAVAESRRSRRTSRQSRRRRTFARARALLVGALVLGVGASATVAAWTDNEFASSQITAGTFSIVSRTASAPTFAAHDAAANAVTLPLNATNLYPGQSRSAWIQITTAGSVPGTVQLTGVVAPTNGANGDTLRDSLDVRIVPTTAAANTTPTCDTGTTGGITYTGIGNVPTTLPAQTLQANGTNVVNYCIIITVRADAATTAQGGIVTPTWTFTGTTG
ncbi:SipW-dependent-type signal peptide-containing protein [Microbacterium murale]|uniref:Ribosomally synthesized peptide with SipW-like signal peptide n=1 Tax=Microbacterium murale TaxID=1081040 RepID=A0ABU0P597_9MICO|nr:SipW-dependent-type signal peptide-containing protein [Microbacterium murale]MDQ0641891.1 putative ribosomally synthesized peptide with SipW-like signal peptide [Microbacterium murale]